MKKLLILCMAFSLFLSVTHSKKAHADPGWISAIAFVVVTGGVLTVWMITDDDGVESDYYGAEKIENLQSDSMEYFASHGEIVSPLLQQVLKASYRSLEEQGVDTEEIDEAQIVRAILQNVKVEKK